MRRAARFGDGWMPYLLSPGRLRAVGADDPRRGRARRPEPRRVRVDGLPVHVDPPRRRRGPRRGRIVPRRRLRRSTARDARPDRPGRDPRGDGGAAPGLRRRRRPPLRHLAGHRSRHPRGDHAGRAKRCCRGSPSGPAMAEPMEAAPTGLPLAGLSVVEVAVRVQRPRPGPGRGRPRDAPRGPRGERRPRGGQHGTADRRGAGVGTGVAPRQARRAGRRRGGHRRDAVSGRRRPRVRGRGGRRGPAAGLRRPGPAEPVAGLRAVPTEPDLHRCGRGLRAPRRGPGGILHAAGGESSRADLRRRPEPPEAGRRSCSAPRCWRSWCAGPAAGEGAGRRRPSTTGCSPPSAA